MSLSTRFFTIVKPREAKILERFGRYSRTLNSGLHFMIPFVDSIKSSISMKEKTIQISKQEVITKDNVDVKIDGVLYCSIVDPYIAAYECGDPTSYLERMAKSLLRCEIGQITLDATLHEREKINTRLLSEIKSTADRWGVECKRYEIKSIYLDDEFVKLMNYEADSERYKRGKMLNAEAFKVSSINNAQRDCEKIIKKGSAEAKTTYLEFKALAEKVDVLRQQLDSGVSSQEFLDFKLKNDLIAAYEELADENKSLFLKKDFDNFKTVFDGLNQQYEVLKEHGGNDK